MSLTVEAVYEDGLLKPVQPLPFAQHQKVTVTVDANVNVARQTAGMIQRTDGLDAAAVRSGCLPEEGYQSGLEQRFRELVRQWKGATEFMSSSTEMVLHPAYQQIIGMGPSALPLLIAELRRDPDHWFAALKSISGDDPVPAEDRGKVPRMVQAWVSWGEKRGY